MYSPKIINRNLDALVEADQHLPIEDRFDPIGASIADCRAVQAELQSIIDPETGKRRRALTRDEQRWVRNEQLRCQASYRYWTERYARITNWEGQLSGVTFNIAQEMVLEKWGDIEELGVAVMMLELKARQLWRYYRDRISHRTPRAVLPGRQRDRRQRVGRTIEENVEDGRAVHSVPALVVAAV